MSTTVTSSDVDDAGKKDTLAGRAPGAVSAPVRRPMRKLKPVTVFLFVLTLAGALAALVPFYMMVMLSLKTPAEIAQSPWTLPKSPQWGNYVQAFLIPGTEVTFATFFKNTLIIATLSTLGTTFSSSLVAYGFARLRFPGRDQLFILLLATMMLPGIVTLIPSYIGFTYLHWIDTLYPLIVPSFFAGAFNVFLLRQFFMTLPRELDEAARIDGASYFDIYWKVLMPLCKPALITVALFAFIYSWKDLMAPLIYLNSVENQTLELGLRTFSTLHGTDWQFLMAGSVFVLVPLLVLFFLGQRYFIKGIVMTGLKD
jgi:multiple sugar transport system permease protein